MAELVRIFEPEIESITLVPGEGGVFEVTVNEKLVYSKIETHRHAEPGEVSGIIRRMLMEAA